MFRKDTREWVAEAMPTMAPEPIRLKGLVKVGRLGDASAFQIFDGSRSVNVAPEGGFVADFKALFGQVVDLSAVAEYRPDGSIKRLVSVSEVKPFHYETAFIIYGERQLSLSHPLRFEVETDERARQFILTEPEFDIVAHGETLAEAIDAAQEEFVVLWDSLARAPIEELHESALPVREKLQKIVQRDTDSR